MSTLYNCSPIISGDRAFTGITMNSVSSYDMSSSSHESSQEGTEPMVVVNMPIEDIRSFLSMNPVKTFLRVTEEPVEKFRFRYKSEMMGTHGSILARSHERNRRKIYPSVQLCNFNGPAIIRCSLYTAHSNEKLRTPHTHRLIVRAENNLDKDDPHEMIVSHENDYTAIFHGMGIIHTAKKHIIDELFKKKQFRLLEKLQAKNINIMSLTTAQVAQLRLEAEDEARRMNLNSVSLCFEAFTRDANNCLQQICDPVFSKPINNMKSALTGELKICRIDKHTSSCLGGEEVFILVEKVGKKNIKIKFFEEDEDGTEIWCDYGKFSELDVHHQYAIVFRTPPYRDLEIDKTVDVCLQLYRPTDGDRSEPIKFQYKPSDKMSRSRKRQRLAAESLHSGDKNVRLLTDIANSFANNNGAICIDPSLELLDQFPSLDNLSEILDADNCTPDFRDYVERLSLDFILPQPPSGLGSLGSENLQMPVKHDMDPACTAAYVCNPGFAFSGGFKTEGIVARDSIRDYLEDVVCDGERSSPSNKEVISQTYLKNFSEKKKTSDSGANSVKKEPLGDLKLLQKALDEIENTLRNQVSPSDFEKKVNEIFSVTNEEGDNALHACVLAGQNQVLQLLLQVLERGHHTDMLNFRNLKGETPLHLAVLNTQHDMVKLLVNQGADPNIGDELGNTALHVAIKHGHDNCLLEILENDNSSKIKPNLNIKNENGECPLHLSALQNNLFAVKKLVAAGANVNEVDSLSGRHVLHVAAQQGNKDIVEFLVKKTTIDVNLTNLAGNTALHYACVVDGGSPDICKLLIDAKANPRIINFEHCTKEIPDLLNVEIKEEIDSEDDLQLRIDDIEDVDDDDEEDEDEEEGSMQGQSSIDLAWNNKEILEILKKAEVTNSVLSEELRGIIKKEPMSPVESVSDNGLFDEETLARLCTILDSSGVWINLADLLDYTFLVPSIRTATSPTKLLFNYADLHGNVTVQNIRNFLEALDESEAVEAIDLMLARRISSSEENE